MDMASECDSNATSFINCTTDSNLTSDTQAAVGDEWMERYLLEFINLPILSLQIILGVLGNAMNLLVLLSRRMRSRTNLLFSGIALADLLFLLSRIHQVLYFGLPAVRNSRWYMANNSVFYGLENFFSAISIWMMVLMTCERVAVFRRPFEHSVRSPSRRFAALLSLVALGALPVTVFYFLPRDLRSEHPTLVTVLIVINASLVVFLPCCAIMALNLLLLVYIRQNQFAIAVDKQRAAASGGDMTGTWHRPFPAGLLLITTTTPSQDSPTSVTATPKSAVTNKSTTPTGSCGNRALMVARAKREKKITIMVMVITFTFVVCNAPSAIFFILRQFGVMMSTRARENLLTGSLNCLVTTGKVLNFMLFCVASRHFRKQLGAHWRRFGRAIPRLRRMSNISQPAAYHNHNAHGHRSSRNTCITSTGDGPTTGERLPMLEKSDYLGDQQHNDGVFALALSAAPIRRRAAVQHNLTQQQQQQQPPQKEEPIELEATQQQPIEPEATQQQQQPSRHIALPSAPQDLYARLPSREM